MRASRTGGLGMVWPESRDTTEVWLFDLHDPEAPARGVASRRRGIDYASEHARTSDGVALLIVTNDGAESSG